jgi:hypothetical protein
MQIARVREYARYIPGTGWRSTGHQFEAVSRINCGVSAGLFSSAKAQPLSN